MADISALVAERLTKGDSPGHPFRGNQYTEGEAWDEAADRGPLDGPAYAPIPKDRPDALSDWGSSHDESMSITSQAARMMGVPGYEEVYTDASAGMVRRRHRGAAAYMLDRIATSRGSEEA